MAPKRLWNTVLPVLTRKRANATSVENALKAIFGSLQEDELISEDEIIARLKDELRDIEERYRDEKVLRLCSMLCSSPMSAKI